MDDKPNLLIGVTGSVATIKLPQLYNLLKSDFNIRIIVTKHAKHFLLNEEGKPSEEMLPLIYQDQQEWQQWKNRGDPVLHIELSKWADILLIAPLSANTLAKLSNGLCDNLLTLVCRAWDMKTTVTHMTMMTDYSVKLNKPILICPSMNTMMYEHPITAKQLSTLGLWGYYIIPAQSKKLVCGDVGMGAMASLEEIVLRVKQKGRRVQKKA